eukprot:4106688-Prymnesium_polylepis.1
MLHVSIRPATSASCPLRSTMLWRSTSASCSSSQLSMSACPVSALKKACRVVIWLAVARVICACMLAVLVLGAEARLSCTDSVTADEASRSQSGSSIPGRLWACALTHGRSSMFTVRERDPPCTDSGGVDSDSAKTCLPLTSGLKFAACPSLWCEVTPPDIYGVFPPRDNGQAKCAPRFSQPSCHMKACMRRARNSSVLARMPRMIIA